MPISYKKLFHLLIDRNIKEGEFRKLAEISAPTLGKLKSGETITTEMISKICKALECQPADIMEYVPEKQENT
ncbi:MAG: helix-turn-helix domain-containing protein [Ruminiclostridium sp.]